MAGFENNLLRRKGKNQNTGICAMENIDSEPLFFDEGLEQALDRLGELTPPPSAASESDFVSRVMRQIGDTRSLRQPRPFRRPARDSRSPWRRVPSLRSRFGRRPPA